MADLAKFKETAAEKPKGFPAILEAYKPQIAAALPKHLNADRMARIALTCYRMTPKLAECEPLSVFAAVIQAAQLGLEPGLNGRAYLIPYGTQCQFVPGWKGLVELANRSGRASIQTGVIYKDQKYEFVDGSTRTLKILNETECEDAADITHAYAVGRIKGMEDWPYLEVWRVGKIERHRDRYNKVGKRHYSFENWEMYARKVTLLQVLKYLPSTPELEAAIILNDSAEVGQQNLSVRDAIDGTFAHVPDDLPLAAGSPKGPDVASGSGQPQTGGSEEIFAACDDAIKAKDWDLARDLLRSPKLTPSQHAMLKDRIPAK